MENPLHGGVPVGRGGYIYAITLTLKAKSEPPRDFSRLAQIVTKLKLLPNLSCGGFLLVREMRSQKTQFPTPTPSPKYK